MGIELDLNMNCPCGSGTSYENCCGQYHLGKDYPDTAEKLMRSRYSAFKLMLVDYINKTVHPAQMKSQDDYATEENLAGIEWTKLEVLSISMGQAADKIGKVEFKAHYKVDGDSAIHHELSRFKRYKKLWVYFDGTVKE